MGRTKFLYIIFICFQLIDVCLCQACGSVLNGNGTIVSQGHPSGYPSFHECSWTIQANDYDIVNIQFQDFHVEPGENCAYDYLKISASGNSKKFCGDKLSDVGANGRLRLRGRVTLEFQTDDSVNLRGFSLFYQVELGEPPTTTPPSTTTHATTPAPALTCNDEPCQNGGECTMLDDTDFFCFCEDGFQGEICEFDIDECASSPCQNNGTCIDGANSWTCECVQGFIGLSCAVNVNDCLENSCKNGATCEDQVNAFYCSCTLGWTGWDCGTEIDECTPNPCQNHGVCDDHLGYHTCVCHPSYTGENCTISVDSDTTPPNEVSEPVVTTILSPTKETTVQGPSTSEMEIESLPIMTTPASLQSPQDYSEVDQPEATRTPIGSELDQQNNFTSTHRTETTSKPEITTQQENKLLKNVTTQPNSSVSDDIFGFPFPVVIGVVGGIMSFAGAAAAVYRCFKPSVKSTKIKPIPKVVQSAGTTEYFQH